MKYDDVEILGKHVQQVEADNAELRAEIERLEAENKRLKLSVHAKIADHVYGTPCEQVRHKQEVDDLKAEIERLRQSLKRIAPTSCPRCGDRSIQQIARDALREVG